MPKFRFTALTAEGLHVGGVEEAPTIGRAREALADRQLRPVSVTEKKSIWQLEITRKKVPRKELMHFSRELGAFLEAGVTVVEGLRVIGAEMANRRFQQVVLDMVDALEAGETLAGAAAAHPEAFPAFYTGILRSAEMSGNLDGALNQLSSYIEREVEARQKITSALAYPGLVMVMSIIAVCVLTIFVMPRFANFFASFDAKLPLPTRILMAVTHFITHWWFAIAIPLVAVVVGLGLLQRTERGKVWRDTTLLKLPLFGRVLQMAIIERFCRVLSSMVNAGVPLPDAILVLADGMGNRVFSRQLLTARESMLHGDGFAGPLAATGLFPAAARQMFRVGEDTGTLDRQMETAARYFDRELDYTIKNFTTIFEPAVITVMGLVVGFVAIALVSAMYGIYHQIKFS